MHVCGDRVKGDCQGSAQTATDPSWRTKQGTITYVVSAYCHVMTESRTYVITGTSGMLAGALRQRLEGQGHRVVGIDVDASAEVVADLSSADGRASMLRDVVFAYELAVERAASAARSPLMKLSSVHI